MTAPAVDVQFFSDLHLEFGNPLPPVAASCCIAAGDICVTRQLPDLLAELGRRYDAVYFVPGNHEFYGSSLAAVDQLLVSLETRIGNLVYLRPGRHARLGPLKVVGCTLWYGGDPANADHIERCIADTHYIADGSYEQFVALGRSHRQWLSTAVDEDTLVVTHHLPSRSSIAPQFAASRLNGAFVNDCEEIIRQNHPLAWIHGHTHHTFDYHLGRTRVLCNPLGYPNESTRFQPDRVLHLPAFSMA